MTTAELRAKLNDEIELGTWPKNILFVDYETYANVCHDIFKHKFEDENLDGLEIRISLGLNGSIMFKGIELILERDNK